MSIECNNTTPFSSRFDSDALTPSSTVFADLIDFNTLIDQENPLDKVDRDSVVSITNKLNDILAQEVLDAFPTLQNKFNQFPLTFTEIADFALTNSVDTVAIIDALNQYTPQIGLNNTLTNLFSDLDFFYEDNLGQTIAGGQCAAFGNILTGLSTLFSLIDTGKKLLADIQSLELDPQKLLKDLAGKLTLQGLIDKVEEIIEQLIEKVKKKILQAINSIIPQLKKLGCASKALFHKMNNEIKAVKEHFSDDNMESFKDKVKEFFTNLTSQFNRTSVEGLALLMYKLCQMTESLHNLLSGPGKDLLKAAEVIAIEVKVLSNVGLKNTKKAVENGAIRLSPEKIAEKRKKVLEKYQSDLTDEHLTDPCPTAEEIEIISNMTNKGLTERIKFRGEDTFDALTGNIVTSAFQSLVEEEVLSTFSFEAGTEVLASPASSSASFDSTTFSEPLEKEWSKVDVSVWAKLLRVQKQTNADYVVLHGVKEKTSTTANMGGRSNHIHLTPYAIDISVNDANRDITIKAASKAGFTGIGIYKTFLHLDTGARRAWVAGEPDINIKSSEQFRDEELDEMQTLATMHEADDHRKARIEALQRKVNKKDTTPKLNKLLTPEQEEAVNKIKSRSYNAL